MAEKHTRKGKEPSLILVCIVLAPILISGCSHLPRAFPVRAAFQQANALSSQGNYQAALSMYERICEEHPSARDRALFEMGIILAHPENELRDYQKANGYFQKLINDYPENPYRQNSETMLFNINNVLIKDRTISKQHSQIDLLYQEIKRHKNEIRNLKKQLESIERKYFTLALEKGVADRILIEKEERRMTLFLKGEVLKTYNIALGGDPIGPKERQGDNKTPEGTYTIDSRNRDSRYHLALRLSYPNEKDKRRARELGVSPGGDIMIHGLRKGFSAVGDAHAEVDWTKGCIAVTDEEIEEIERLAPNGTVVEITP